MSTFLRTPRRAQPTRGDTIADAIGQIAQSFADTQLRQEAIEATQKANEARISFQQESLAQRAALANAARIAGIQEAEKERTFKTQEREAGEAFKRETSGVRAGEEKPSAGNISVARTSFKRFSRDKRELLEKKSAFAINEGFDPEVGPPPAEGFGKKKKQLVIDNWNKILSDEGSINTRLDTLFTRAAGKNITREEIVFGSGINDTTTPPGFPDPANLEGRTGTDSSGVKWIVRDKRWVRIQ